MNVLFPLPDIKKSRLALYASTLIGAQILAAPIAFGSEQSAEQQIGHTETSEPESQEQSVSVIEINAVEVVAEQIIDEEFQNAQETYLQPYTKQVVGEKRIEQESSADVKEAVRHVAGVSVRESGAFYKILSIRGLSGRRVSSLIDGIKLPNQGFDRSGGGEINTVDTSTVKKIEVVRGSPAVIYDPGASGGVINVTTKPVPDENGIRLSHTLGLDQGYDKVRNSFQLVAAYEGWGLRANHARQKASDYRVRGHQDTLAVIGKTNAENETSDTQPISVSDLGYDTYSTSIRLSKQLFSDVQAELDYDDWVGNDLAYIYGDDVSQLDGGVILTHEKTRSNFGGSLKKEQLWGFTDLHARYSHLEQSTQSTEDSTPQTLDTDAWIASGNYLLGDVEFITGAEVALDQAVTAIYSEQDYYAAYLNSAYMKTNYNLHAGIRYNQWQTRQKLLPGTNEAVARDLVGISGSTPPIDVYEPTWSLGAQYQLTYHQNISLNYSRTFRNPDLYERYIFDGSVIGGGVDLKPEEGHHTELTYKFLDDHFSLNAGVFYSDFDNFIWTKAIRKITNRSGLEQCISLGLCDPTTGDYNDQESDFFTTQIKYYNAKHVTNHGMELSANYLNRHHDISANMSFNKIASDDVYVRNSAQPLKLNIGYKYNFANTPWQPWIKVSAEHVWDTPRVEQRNGFDQYTVFNAYSGFQNEWLRVNVGIRNIANTTYKAPYSVLNGLERSIFGSVTVVFDTFSKQQQ
ncbi:MAG: TonB-dependent receptor [Pseudomonadota bacterium]|nr:TonB-dependent receptor [Pseudomonadota bacterium]